MPLDQVENFVEVNVAGTHSSTETTISLQSGEASNLPDPSGGEFNLVWFDSTNFSRPSEDNSVEIVRVTGRDITNDTITVLRGQENTTAVAHDTSNSDYVMILAQTAKMIEDVDAADFSTNTVTVAGNSVALGSSTAVNHSDLSNIGTGDHHTRYSDEEAQDAVGGILNADFSYDDAGNSISLASNSLSVAGNSVALGGTTTVDYTDLNDTGSSFPIPNTDLSNSSLTVANTNISLGGSGTPEADNLGGSNGTSGQFLQTDGNNLTFADVTTFSGNHSDLENVQEDQHHKKGMSQSERQAFNDTVSRIARNEFESNLTQLNYDGGIFTVYRDKSKISKTTDVEVKTLKDGFNGSSILPKVGFFDVSTATFTTKFDTSTQSQPFGLTFDNDGDKMFICGRDDIHQYSLSTSFDVSTASFTKSFNVSSRDGDPQDVVFSDTGDKMFFVGSVSDKVYEYSLSTSFDIGTASFTDAFGVSIQDNDPVGMAFNNEGDKMFVSGTEFSNVYEYSLSTGFDVSTASFTDSFDYSNQEPAGNGVTFNDTGDKMFISGIANDKAFEYSLSTSFDVSTASFTDSFLVNPQGESPQSLAFDNKGKKLFVAGKTQSQIVEYDIPVSVKGSGSIELVQKDLSKAENGGFSSPPSSAVLSQSADIPTDTDITYTLRDGNGNTATVTQSDVDTVINTSNFTSTTVEVEVNLSQSTTNDDKSPTSKDVMVHFKQ